MASALPRLRKPYTHDVPVGLRDNDVLSPDFLFCKSKFKETLKLLRFIVQRATAEQKIK